MREPTRDSCRNHVLRFTATNWLSLFFNRARNSSMRRPILILALCFTMCAAASAATGGVVKVLPQFLDLKGRSAISPSLYDRDAYQAHLREHTNEISGIRFAVQWKAHGASDGQ